MTRSKASLDRRRTTILINGSCTSNIVENYSVAHIIKLWRWMEDTADPYNDHSVRKSISIIAKLQSPHAANWLICSTPYNFNGNHSCIVCMNLCTYVL